MAGGLARKALGLLALLGLALAAGGCDAEAGRAEAAARAYYDSVARGDVQGQAALWLPDRQAEASREAEAWARREKEGLKLETVHISEGPTGDQRIVHITLSVEDRVKPGTRRYESRVLLLQLLEKEWRIRDVR